MNYQIDRYMPDGTRISTVEAFHRLIYQKTESKVGALQIEMPLKDWKLEDWSIGQVLELWREKNGVYQLQNETVYFVQDWDVYNQSGQHMLRVYALDANWLLSTRIVADYAGSARAEMQGKADMVMGAFVRNELCDAHGTSPERKIPNFTTFPPAGATGQSQNITKGGAWQNVLNLVQEIAELATEKGTYTCFDVIRTVPMNFEFHVYVGQRGTDHSRDSGDPRFVGEAYGNLEDAMLSILRGEEYNYIYAGGRGEKSERVIKYASDATRIGQGYPFNRKEFFRDSRHQEEANGVQDDAYAALAEGKPKTIMTGKIIDTPGMQYGIDYGFGDILTVEAFGYSIDCHVNSVRLTYDSEEGEQFEIRLRGELE